MCYVGKATKIFIGVAAVLLVAGLVLGLGVFRHGLQRAPHRCDGGGCPDYPHPLPASSSPNGSNSNSSAAAASPPPPQPFPNPVPPVASTEPVTAAPPPVQTPPSAAPPPALSPPIPVAAAQGPGPFLAHNRSSSTL